LFGIFYSCLVLVLKRKGSHVFLDMCAEGGHRGRLRVYKFFAMFSRLLWGKKV